MPIAMSVCSVVLLHSWFVLLPRYQRAVRYVDYLKIDKSDPEEKQAKAKEGQEVCAVLLECCHVVAVQDHTS